MELDARDSIQEVLKSAQAAEEMEYEILWIPDETFQKDPYSMMAACALNTRKIRLGVAVTNPYTRSPVTTARAIATCSEISDGRAILGLGGGGAQIASQLGLKQEKMAQAVRDATIIIMKLLQGENVSFQSEEFFLKNVTLELNVSQRVPMYIAGRGPKILELGGEIGDGVIVGAGLTTPTAMAYAFEHVTRGMSKANREQGSVDIVCWAFTSMSKSIEEAKSSIMPEVALITKTVPLNVLKKIGVNPGTASTIKTSLQENPDRIRSAEWLHQNVDDRLLSQFSIVGNPDECVERIKDLEKAGVRHIGVVPIPSPSMSTSRIIKAFAHDIIMRLGD